MLHHFENAHRLMGVWIKIDSFRACVTLQIIQSFGTCFPQGGNVRNDGQVSVEDIDYNFIRILLTQSIISGYNIIAMNYTAFHGFRKIAAGTLSQVAVSLRDVPQGGEFLVFDDSTGSQTDLDTRGSIDEISVRYGEPVAAEPRGRGRPRLGVVAREVTLLPRHWDWLGSQPGGASVALRKLVDQARRNSGDRDRVRAAQEAAYRFLSALAGNLPGFEEATRALFAYDRRRFADLIAAWPQDVRDYAVQLAFSDQRA